MSIDTNNFKSGLPLDTFDIDSLFELSSSPVTENLDFHPDLPVPGSSIDLGDQNIIEYVGTMSMDDMKALSSPDRAELVRQLAEGGWDMQVIGDSYVYTQEINLIKSLYETMEPSQAFLDQTDTIVSQMTEFLEENYDLDNLQASWANMSTEDQEALLTNLSNQMFEVMGINPIPTLEFEKVDPEELFGVGYGSYDSQENILTLNIHQNSLGSNFNQALSTTFHESLHAYQDQLVDTLLDGAIAPDNPIYPDVAMLWANGLIYANIDASRWGQGYEQNPKEAQAWSATSWLQEALGMEPRGSYNWDRPN